MNSIRKVFDMNHSIPVNKTTIISRDMKRAVQTLGFIYLLTFLVVGFASSKNKVDFRFEDLGGKQHQLADYQGQWVVVNFWATWCSPCIREIPELKHFYDEYREQGVTVLGVNYEELTIDQLQKAAEEFAITYPVLHLGADPHMSEQMVLKGLPSTFVISPEGVLTRTWIGPVNKDELVAEIKPRLASINSKVLLK